MTNTISNAGSATGIDLAALADRAEKAAILGTENQCRDELLAICALARATPQHPDLTKLQAIADRVAARGLFNASCDIREWIEEAKAATPQHSVTDQASIGDDPEFARLLGAYGDWQGDDTRGALISYIDSRTKPLASTAASEQQAGADERADFVAWMKAHPGYPFAGAFANLMWAAWQARAATPDIATTADQQGDTESALLEAHAAAAIAAHEHGEHAGYYDDLRNAETAIRDAIAQQGAAQDRVIDDNKLGILMAHHLAGNVPSDLYWCVDVTAEGLRRAAAVVQGAAQAQAGGVASAMQVGCERDDGLLNIHAEGDTCEVCAPATSGGSNV